MGILFRPNFTVGGYIGIQDLLDDGYKSVFIGTGAWRPKRLNIPGETFGNVQYAVNYLNNPDVYDLGDHVAVIGAGNAAMDVITEVYKQGAKEVTAIDIREPSAFEKEIKGLATWNKPTGGYFISLYVPGKAKQVVDMCKELGVTLTSTGSSYPYKKDPDNSHIRIAPTPLSLEELETATKVICLVVKLIQ